MLPTIQGRGVIAFWSCATLHGAARFCRSTSGQACASFPFISWYGGIASICHLLHDVFNFFFGCYPLSAAPLYAGIHSTCIESARFPAVELLPWLWLSILRPLLPLDSPSYGRMVALLVDFRYLPAVISFGQATANKREVDHRAGFSPDER